MWNVLKKEFKILRISPFCALNLYHMCDTILLYRYGRDAPFSNSAKYPKGEQIMPHTIAVAGKGGVGKTTTCGMMIDYLCKKRRGPVLVVDADANSNLNEVLGVEVETSLGQIREEMAQAELKGTIPKGMTKADYAEFKFNSALIEDDDFDMLVMGINLKKDYSLDNPPCTSIIFSTT